MINNAATGHDFDNLATMFNDSTWSYANMRNYFKRIENNLYLEQLELRPRLRRMAENQPQSGFHPREPQVRRYGDDITAHLQISDCRRLQIPN
jgi:choline dehydrogenase-like flavoprotein